MKTLLCSATFAAMTLMIPAAFGQQAAPSTTTPPQAAQAPLTPEQFDQQLAKMQEPMVKMQEQMTRLQQTQSPEERQRLVQDHWATMQTMMTLMQGTWGGMMGMGPMMMGGHMMGGPMMMWGNYQNLTPEQRTQRQYMIDR